MDQLDRWVLLADGPRGHVFRHAQSPSLIAHSDDVRMLLDSHWLAWCTNTKHDAGERKKNARIGQMRLLRDRDTCLEGQITGMYDLHCLQIMLQGESLMIWMFFFGVCTVHTQILDSMS